MKRYIIKKGIVFKDNSKFYPVKIECPECGKICNAEVEVNNFPFASYVHKCEHCGYIITESEWNEIKLPRKLKKIYKANLLFSHNDNYTYRMLMQSFYFWKKYLIKHKNK